MSALNVSDPVVAALLARVTAVETTSANILADSDSHWLMMCAFLVFFMQAGFAMVEVGSITKKNTKNILLKNCMDACLGAIIFWAVGYGVAYGNSDAGGFIGNDNFFLTKNDGSAYDDYKGWLFQWAFAATAATIVSGSMAERTQFSAYLVYTTIITAFIYPVVVHWVWDGTGWISAFNGDAPFMGVGMVDFAGSGVVHMTGGFAGLAGAIVLGPRNGFADEKWAKRGSKLPPQNVLLCTLGTFILWFGWYGFNPGSTLAINGYGAVAAKVAVTTTLSAAAAGLSALMLEYGINKQVDLCMGLNGVLAGLVSITAPCSVVEPVGAFFLGLIGGMIYVGSHYLLLRLNIDDPLDASPVHGFCGIWGCLCSAIFGTADNMATVYGVAEWDQGNQFGIQFVGALVIFLWAFFTSLLMFVALKKTIGLRVSAEMEEKGMDESKHGGTAFPEYAPTVGGEKKPEAEMTETPAAPAPVAAPAAPEEPAAEEPAPAAPAEAEEKV